MGQSPDRFASRRRWAPAAVAVAVVSAATVIAAAAIASRALGIPVQDLLADPLSRVGAHPLIGFASNIGILLWAMTAGVCMVAALVLRGGAGGRRRAAWRFFTASAALTVLLMLDDTYQLHEDLVPRLLGHGQTFILGGYVIVVGGYVWWFRHYLASTAWVVLACAGVCFAVSIAIDLLPVALSHLPGSVGIDPESDAFDFVTHVIEDGSKLIGIALWLAFFVDTATTELAPTPESGAAEGR